LQEVEDQCEEGSNQTKSHQRKFLSSENLHHIRSTVTSQTVGHRQQKDEPTPYGSVDKLACNQLESIPVISTKPLSPQSTSEDFKIYLANIQFLQSASNILDEKQLKDLNGLFLKSYKNQSKDQNEASNRQFNNDDVLNSKIGTDPGSLISFGANENVQKSSPDADQRELLVKLHQEFWNLPTNYQEKPMVFGSQSKNRYKTILPNEHSRVMLQKEEGCMTQPEPYINANFIKVSIL
jgi:tyrosine-protein phosphatase ERK